MRKPSPLVHATSAFSLTVLATGSAAAQVYYEPNALLLIDSSGSMEYQVGFNDQGDEVFPHCDPAAIPAAVTCGTDEQIYRVKSDKSGFEYLPCLPNERSRWITLVEVLTGDVKNYRCDKVDRTASDPDFLDLVRVNGTVDPYDLGYENPYHRLIGYEGGALCSPAPLDVTSPDATVMPKDEIVWRPFDQPRTGTECVADFQSNGLIDQFKSTVRFGLMTFDTEPDPGIGETVFAEGNRGTWSYYPQYLTTPLTSFIKGKADGCTTLSDWEVGGRNPFAPSWEGRLIGFGPQNAPASVVRNESIEEVLLATRPYGATPIAGMLEDAYELMYNDGQDDPLDTTPGNLLGPKLNDTAYDPASQDGCRQNNIVLLTDGEPNLDLRPYCEGGIGVCPYDKPEDTAHTLSSENPATSVYVVGFSMETVQVNAAYKDCADLDRLNDCTSAAIAASTTPRALQACCRLNEIAYQGGTDHAYFARDKDTLRTELSTIFQLIASTAPAHTRPVMGNTGVGGGLSFRFFTGFTAGMETRRGIIERQRWTCAGGGAEATPQPVDRTQGDDFVANVNSAASGRARHFATFVVEPVPSAAPCTSCPAVNEVHSEFSIRPRLDTLGYTGDAIGTLGGTVLRNSAIPFADAFQTVPDIVGEGTPAATALAYAKWWVGLNNGSGKHRCETPGSADCNLVADVDFSTPAAVGRPSALLPDETYTAFASLYGTRPLVLYTATNDGFLHAFQVHPQVTPVGSNNELWAFAPPAVLPQLTGLYSTGHARLNDGEPIIRDVVATLQTGSLPPKLERTPDDVRTGGTTWRTILLQSLGTDPSLDTTPGYYALDVTAPDPLLDDPQLPIGTKGGPKFLWQLTTDNAGGPLFGTTGGTPLITTLYFADNGDPASAREVAVAVLPGGGASSSAGTCTTSAAVTASSIDIINATTYTPRTNVRCWGGGKTPARSLNLVRLDTGQLIRRFANVGDYPLSLGQPDGSGLASVVTHAPLVAPIVGKAAAFPAGTGAVADRLYVGDAEGLLWRVDLSSVDPDDWSMDLMFDAFNDEVNPSGAQEGEPIATAPIVSTNPEGKVIVLLSTGEQNPTQTSTKFNVVWSLREDHDGTNHTVAVNWYKKLGDTTGTAGERVTGPMQLFNNALFFSTYRATENCYVGESRIWGMHYTDASSAAAGGNKMLPVPTSVDASGRAQSATLEDLTGNADDAESNVYGVTVAQVPSCADEAGLDSDGFAGGKHTSVTNVNPGRFQLIMHTGKAGSTSTGGMTEMAEVDLPTPAKTAIIDSWAAIVE